MTHHPNAVASLSPEEHRSGNRAKKVLVVAYDDNTRGILRVVLEQHPYEVDEAQNSNQALEKVQSWEPDLVTTDLGRPEGGSIFDFLRMVKNRRPSLPVLVVTAPFLTSGREMCMAEGAFDFIETPFDPKHLLSVVSKALSQPHSG
jgi:DNA-binding NtrC family response regulator